MERIGKPKGRKLVGKPSTQWCDGNRSDLRNLVAAAGGDRTGGGIRERDDDDEYTWLNPAF